MQFNDIFDLLFGTAATSNLNNYLELLVRFTIDILVILVLVRYIYYPRHRNKEYFFTFFLFNAVNLLICVAILSFPCSAWERTAFEAPPHGVAVEVSVADASDGGAVTTLGSHARAWEPEISRDFHQMLRRCDRLEECGILFNRPLVFK